MRSTTRSRVGVRRRSRRTLSLCLAAAAALCLTAGTAASAQADAFNFTADHAVIDLGALTGLQILDGSTGPATFDGTVTGNQVTIPVAGIHIPPKSITDPLPVTIQISANSDLVGTYDSATGALTFPSASLRATTSGAANCTISPIVLNLGTENARPYVGERFSSGMAGAGALDAHWDTLPNATGDGLCSLIGQVAGGEGGIWLSHTIATPKTCTTDPSAPACGSDPCVANPNAAGCQPPPNCTTTPTAAGCPPVDPCKTNPAATGCPGQDPCKTNPKASGCPGNGRTTKPAKLSLSAKTKSAKVKAGKSATFKFKVGNTGGTSAKSVKVCVSKPPKTLKAKCVKVGTLAAGKSKSISVKVGTTKKAKKHSYSLNFTASGSSLGTKSAKARLSVR